VVAVVAVAVVAAVVDLLGAVGDQSIELEVNLESSWIRAIP
jgi:hypothetical protein